MPPSINVLRRLGASLGAVALATALSSTPALARKSHVI